MKKSTIAIIGTGVGVLVGSIIGFIVGKAASECEECFDEDDDLYDDCDLYEDDDMICGQEKNWIDLSACSARCSDCDGCQNIDTESLPSLDEDELEKMDADFDELSLDDIFGSEVDFE